jgi:peptidoglycan LD-endopeptidase LytH
MVLAACGRPRVAPEPAPAPPVAVLSEELAGILRGDSLMVPIDGIEPARVRDTFLAPRGDRVHSALDIMAARGTPVIASVPGRVFKIRSNPSGGLTIYALDRSERFVYYYAHLDAYREGLSEGERLETGALLGYVGTTGNAPPGAPHLHFQILTYAGDGRWWEGTPVNPFPFLVRSGEVRRP